MTEGRFPVRRAGPLAVVTLPEEIDLLNVPDLQRELTALVQQAPGTVVVDMTKTRYCDSSGVATLVRVSKAAAVGEVLIRLAVSDPVLRIIRLLGAEQVLDVHTTLAAALGETPGGAG